MINVTQLKVEDKIAVGLRVDLPDSPPLILIVGRTGFVMCGFLNLEAAEKAKVVAAIVSGVKTFDDALKTKIRAVTSKAQMKGIKVGMRGQDAIKLLF